MDSQFSGGGVWQSPWAWYSSGLRMGGGFWASGLVLLLLCGSAVADGESAHIVFNVDCGTTFGWQTIALLHSIKKSGQPGPVTRLLSCTQEQLEAMDEETLGLVQTYVTPNFAEDPETGEN